MKTCLVTGVTGLIGSHLIPSLIEEGWYVYGITRPQNKCDQISITSNYQVIVIDLASGFDLNSLPKKVDVIIHLAQSRQFREFPELAEDIFRVNTESTLTLLNYALKVETSKFILASTGGIYGTGERPFKENDLPASHEKLGFYASTKLCSEILANNYKSFFAINVLRLFFVYGQGQDNSMLIPRLVNNILGQREISLYGENGICINPIHVSDVVRAISKAIQLSSSQTINIAGNEILSLRDISSIIGDKLNRNPKFNIQEKLPSVSNNLIADISQMIEYLITPKVLFSQGIDSIIAQNYNEK